MKTYFTYEGQIGSKEVAEAIAFPVGLGPFMGFGSAQLTNTKITIQARANTDQSTNNPSPYYKDINDRLLARKLSFRGETTIPSFGVINRSGHLWVSTQPQIEISNIRGSKGAWNEVLVFAVFQDIQEPVNNMPTFVAYWNSSQQSFYEYWRQSIDQSYGKNDLPSLDSEPWVSSTVSFEDLEAKVVAAVGDWYQTQKTAVLIGIYGTGVNVETNDSEEFALVPYGGVFPQSMPFTPDYYFSLKKVLKFLDNFTRDGISGFSSIKAYIDSRLGGQETAEVAGIVPVGGIIAWAGSVVPEGWVICDGHNGTPDLRGKFIMGDNEKYKSGTEGGAEEVILTSNHLPEHKHQIYFQEYKWGDNANRRPFPNNTQDQAIKDGEDSQFNSIYTQNAGKASPEPISILPPFYALAYIMRIR